MRTLASSTKQFSITRTFDAPRDVVWRMWTDPDEAPYWLHPHEVRTPRETVVLDVRPGGAYRYTMIAPDGSEWPTGGQYLDVVEGERLVFTWADPARPDEPAPVVTVELSDVAGGAKTEMRFTLRGMDGQPGDEGVYDGWDEAFEELGAHLGSP